MDSTAVSIVSFVAAQSLAWLESGETVSNEFTAYIQRVIAEQFDGVELRLASELKMSASAFGRGVKKGTLSVENLLKLSHKIGGSPIAILRMGGKAEIAKLLDNLYGPEKTPLSEIDRRLVGLPREAKRAILTAIDAVAHAPPEARTGRAPRAGSV